MDNIEQTQASNLKNYLPKPMLVLVISALATSPTFLAGCSSTTPKAASVAYIEPKTTEQENLKSLAPQEEQSAMVSEEVIEKENQIIAEINHSDLTQLESEQPVLEPELAASEVLTEIDLAIDEITALEADVERPGKTTFKFGFDKKELSAEDKDIVTQHGRFLSQHPTKKIQIHGHADAQGAPLYNEALAKQRAQHVTDLLKAEGVLSEQIEVISWGSNKPMPSGNHWKDHRRVEMIYDEAFMVDSSAITN